MLVYDGVRNIPNHLYDHKITYMHEGIRIMTSISMLPMGVYTALPY